MVADIHTMLLNGFGCLLFRPQEPRGIVFRIEFYFFGYFKTFNRQDLPVVVGIGIIQAFPSFLKGEVAIIQDIVFGVECMPVPVYKRILFGGTGSEQ